MALLAGDAVRICVPVDVGFFEHPKHNASGMATDCSATGTGDGRRAGDGHASPGQRRLAGNRESIKKDRCASQTSVVVGGMLGGGLARLDALEFGETSGLHSR